MAKRTCSIDGCDRSHAARGWCNTHWARWRKHGDPLVGARTPAATCDIAGCGRPVQGHGWCTKHYARWRRGAPVEDQPEPSLAELLAIHADASAGPGGCHPWSGPRHSAGYGLLRGGYAHRLSLELALGRELTDGEYACHHCDNPPCVNPRHLYAGSPADNVRDMVRRGRSSQRFYWVDNDAIRWLYERRVSPDRIADEMGVAPIVIRARLREMGIPSRRAGRPTNAQLRRADAALAEWRSRLGEVSA